MKIDAKENTKVIYTGKGGYNYHKEDANKHLIKGNVYTVLRTEIGGFYTDVYLKEFPTQNFNSVMFQDICNACHKYPAVEDHDKCKSCKGLLEHNFKARNLGPTRKVYDIAEKDEAQDAAVKIALSEEGYTAPCVPIDIAERRIIKDQEFYEKCLDTANKYYDPTIMKEQQKYYTPKIEDLHVGFECEKMDQSLIASEFENTIESQLIGVDYKTDKNKLYKPHKITAQEIYNYSLNPHIFAMEVRVKYLDRQDIEEVGFDFNGQMEFESKEWGYCWEHSIDHTEGKEKYYTLYIDNGIVNIIYCEYINLVGRSEIIKFQGTIKNKSELKKVLQMIGVTR